MRGAQHIRPFTALFAVAMFVSMSPLGATQLIRPDIRFSGPPIRAPMLLLNPVITGYQTNGCVRIGKPVTIIGQHFGSVAGKAVALGGHGIHVDLGVISWSDTVIVATIPTDPRIHSNQRYYLGVERSGHAGWLSNIDKNITICTTGIRLRLSHVERPLRRMVTPRFAPAPQTVVPHQTPAVKDSSPSQGTYDSSYASDDNQAPDSGGDLLGRALPPPPPTPAPIEAQKDSDDVEPGELVVVSANLGDAKVLAGQVGALGYSVKRRRILKGLGLVISVLRLPPGTLVAQALQNLRANVPKVWMDANHRYRLQGDDSAKAYGRELIHWGKPSASCGAGRRIGLVDTSVDLTQPALKGQAVTLHSVLPVGVPLASPDHGTAIAALLVGRPRPTATAGLIPGASLYVASVFRRRGDLLDTTAEDIVNALDWLVRQRVQVINLSLGGPRNLILEAAVQRVEELGIVVVAAAGNGGPDAAPMYPAAQNGVVAVTAVDARQLPYDEANHGSYIAFAAPGVDIWVARPGGGGAFVSGTSYAAPFVTAAIARQGGRPVMAVRALARHARDLGKPGRDPVFGWGLVQASGSCGH